jgi:hypothetical protein
MPELFSHVFLLLGMEIRLKEEKVILSMSMLLFNVTAAINARLLLNTYQYDYDVAT